MNTDQLTPDEYERFAWITGAPMPEWALNASDEDIVARHYMEIAEDFRGICTPDDLKAQLEALSELEQALPDDCSDASDLKLYVHEQEGIAQERDDAMQALETIEQALRDILKHERGGLNRNRTKELADWLTHATTAREGIDRYRFRQDLDI